MAPALIPALLVNHELEILVEQQVELVSSPALPVTGRLDATRKRHHAAQIHPIRVALDVFFVLCSCSSLWLGVLGRTQGVA
jgi:hypothetical protein